jgi:hypothetical protein
MRGQGMRRRQRRKRKEGREGKTKEDKESHIEYDRERGRTLSWKGLSLATDRDNRHLYRRRSTG